MCQDKKGQKKIGGHSDVFMQSEHTGCTRQINKISHHTLNETHIFFLKSWHTCCHMRRVVLVACPGIACCRHHHRSLGGCARVPTLPVVDNDLHEGGEGRIIHIITEDNNVSPGERFIPQGVWKLERT